jgi:hypothetical protein
MDNRYIVPYSLTMHTPIPRAQNMMHMQQAVLERPESCTLLERGTTGKGRRRTCSSATDQDHLMSCEADRITTDWKICHGAFTTPELYCGRKKGDMHNKTTSHSAAGPQITH